MIKTLVLTLNGNAQQLVTPNDAITGDVSALQVWLQPDTANTNPILVGADANVATTYGVRLEAPVTTIPPAPFSLGELHPPRFVPLSAIWVKGTNTEKLRVLYIPYQ